MNPKYLDIALKKQRLQFDIELQRKALVYSLEGIESTLHTIDRVRDGAAWTWRHAPVLSTAAIVVVIAKPKLALRLLRRAWLGWLLFRRSSAGLAPVLALLRQARGPATRA